VSVYQRLFSPFRLGRLELRNRIVMSPMGTNLPGRQGEVTDRLIDYYAARAAGGPGLIVVEGTAVHPSGRAYPLMLDLSRDDLIDGFAKLAAAIHQQGAAVILQMFHGGRNTDLRVSGRPPLGPSAVRGPVGRITPVEMTLDQIELMVEAFGRAADRAVEAGFDGVEIHGAHEYLVHQFISPYCNQRTDAYGGSPEKRMRFPLEIVRRIKHDFQDKILSFRFNANDYVSGGLGPEDTPALAKLLAEAGVDVLNVTGGVFETPHLLIPPLPVAHGTHLPLARAVKEAVNVPVIGVGRITTPAQAELALKRGQADLIACGRALLADADWPAKALVSDWRAIRTCIGCNQGCIDNFFAERPVTCLYNPQAGHESQLAVRRTKNPKKVVVVGAGPAGLEAARVLDLMGHQVILFEADQKIGGQVNLAGRPPDKDEFFGVIRFYQEALNRSRIDLRLGVAADAGMILGENPEAIVIATGAVPLVPDLPGMDNPSVVTAHDVLADRAEVGDKVVILGGGNIGLETAHLLLHQGHRVTVIEMGQQIGLDLGPARRFLLMRRLRELKLRRLIRCKVRRIHSDRISYILEERDGQRYHRELTGVDTIVNAMGVRSRDDLALKLEGRHDHVFLVGDALNPGKILHATSEGARAAHQIDAL
jgi:2,4-dienoyl-CoA reductase-like NADH-dependent reductase (Old Yellow Enzyme family)/thioredoxin reductase